MVSLRGKKEPAESTLAGFHLVKNEPECCDLGALFQMNLINVESSKFRDAVALNDSYPFWVFFPPLSHFTSTSVSEK